VPYALHLNHLITQRKGRRRRGQSVLVRNNIGLIKLHPTLGEEQRERAIGAILEGVVKGNGKEQYALGYEAVRLWTAKYDHVLGDRVLTETEINQELPHIHSIRKTFWDLLPLLPPSPSSTSPYPPPPPKLYLSQLLSDSIDCYIVHM
jgi:hypothetical protein